MKWRAHGLLVGAGMEELSRRLHGRDKSLDRNISYLVAMDAEK
jgi:hypothetical protein